MVIKRRFRITVKQNKNNNYSQLSTAHLHNFIIAISVVKCLRNGKEIGKSHFSYLFKFL